MEREPLSTELDALWRRLWEEWHSPDGSPLRSCTIITTAPNGLMSEIHNRMPAILKPADGGGWRDVTVVRDPAELLRAYDASHQNVMTLQEFIDFDDYIRCMCIGKDRILPMRYDPKQMGHTGLRGRYIYHEDETWLPEDLLDRVLDDSVKLNRALGYDMNSVEFAVKDGIPYAIDFTNPAPDMHIEHLGERYFNLSVDWMVDFAIRAAREGMKTRDHYSWAKLLPKEPGTPTP